MFSAVIGLVRSLGSSRGVGFFVTLGFNESRALRAVADAKQCGGEVILIVRRDSVKAARRAVSNVKEFATSLGVRVRVFEVDSRDWCEVIRLARVMDKYGEVHVVIGGGLRIPQAYTLLAALDVWGKVKELGVLDHDTGEEVVIPEWLVPLVTSPERRGKVRVLLALSAEEPRTRAEVAALANLSEQTVAKYLSYLTKAKLVKRVMPNKYRLTEVGRRVRNLYTAGRE